MLVAVLVIAATLALQPWLYSGVDKDFIAASSVREHMKTVADHIQAYQLQNGGRLPCPDRDAALDGLPEANCWQAGGQNAGALPYRTLNLRHQDTRDPWGRRYTYVVSPAIAQPIPAATGDLRIQNENGNTLTNTAAFALVSHGRNGWGALGYQRSAANQVQIGSAGTQERDNIFTTGQATTALRDAPRNTATDASAFDDHVLYRTPLAP
jgi:type II secretory pathway pseudopilin PulG